MELITKIRNRVLAKVRKWNIIHSNANIGKNTLIIGSVISKDTIIGSHCKLKNVTTDGKIEIGDFTSLWGPNIDLISRINTIKIGNFCSIARNTSFQEFNHNHEAFTTYYLEQNLLKNGSHSVEIQSKGAIQVDHDVWIGAHSVILSGVHIHTGAIVAANSVVTKDVPPYAIVGGNPAKIIRYRFDEATREKLMETQWWTWEPLKIKNEIDFLKGIVAKTNTEN